MQVVVTIPTQEIVDWNSFHDVFAATLGFPTYYGRNMNAWIDCLTYPEDRTALSRVNVQPGDTLTLDLGEIQAFKKRCPEQYAAIVECVAFVNARRIEAGEPPVLLLSFM